MPQTSGAITQSVAAWQILNTLLVFHVGAQLLLASAEAEQRRILRQYDSSGREIIAPSGCAQWIGSGYLDERSISGNFRMDKIDGARKLVPHYGIDIVGTGLIRSPGNGVVAKSGNSPFGEYIIVQQGPYSPGFFDYIIMYHFAKRYAKEGDVVEAGKTPIGEAGRTGTNQVVHLHLEYRKGVSLKAFPTSRDNTRGEIYMPMGADGRSKMPPINPNVKWYFSLGRDSLSSIQIQVFEPNKQYPELDGQWLWPFACSAAKH